MSAPRPMPAEIRERLLGSFVTREAELLISRWRREGYPGHIHPGDPFGIVLAWLWADHPGRAVALLGELLAMLRGADDVTPATVGVEDLLTGVRMALPGSFPDSEYEALAVRVRNEVVVAG